LKKYHIKIYQKTDFQQWNDFVSAAKNATFLFHRDFMEYHHDKFEDFSLLIYDDKKQIQAVLPANRVGHTLFSHQGLTYGGLVFTTNLRLNHVIEMTIELLKFLFENAISCLNYKVLPSIYTQFPADEMEYLMFILKAKLIRRDALSVVSIANKIAFSKDRKQGVSRGFRNNLLIKEESNFDAFWNEILVPNLSTKHLTKPVHSLEEITYLKTKFPNNIRQFNVYFNSKIVAGSTIFDMPYVAHSQYISANEHKNSLGSLDFLHHYLITEVFNDKIYFDFGISNENQGKNINEGLNYWKESFGARCIIQNFYEIETVNYQLLEAIFI